jgi:hypothetical protein
LGLESLTGGRSFLRWIADTSMLKDDQEFFRTIYQFFASANRLTWTSIGVTVMMGFLYVRLFFPKPNGFNDIPYGYTRRADYQWLRLRVIIFIMISVGAGVLAYHQLPDWFPNTFRR